MGIGREARSASSVIDIARDRRGTQTRVVGVVVVGGRHLKGNPHTDHRATYSSCGNLCVPIDGDANNTYQFSCIFIIDRVREQLMN